MYGSGSAKPPIEEPGKKARLRQHSAPSDKENMNTNTKTSSSDTVTAAGPNPSTRPQVQHDASTASIKSGMLGHGSGEPQLHQESVNSPQPTDPFRSPITYPKRTEFDDQSLNVERRVDPEFTQTEEEETAAIGQTSSYRSYPLATGDKTSPLPEREHSQPRSHHQQKRLVLQVAEQVLGLEPYSQGRIIQGLGTSERTPKFRIELSQEHLA
jgi:hypothetical protein